MSLLAALESDLRALSSEARRKFPAIKDGAEHAILKLRLMSSTCEVAQNEEIVRIFLMACERRTVKMSVIALSSLQKLISHHAISPPAFAEIISTLKHHAEMADESVQLKTLQTVLIIFQSFIPNGEEIVAQALAICLHLYESNRSSDSVRNTAAATFRQTVALIFDHICVELLSAGKVDYCNHIYRSSSGTDDICEDHVHTGLIETHFVCDELSLRTPLSEAGRLGLNLLENLAALAGGGSAVWLNIQAIQRTFALDILEFLLSNYAALFRTSCPYEQVLRGPICSLLMTSLRTNVQVEGDMGEPSYHRSVLRSVGHIIRLYSSGLVTECEVFLNTLVKVLPLEFPSWHRILVLEIIRGFCMEAKILHFLFQKFDMAAKNTNIVENIVKALAQIVVSSLALDSSEETLVAVAGMFNSKAKGVEWSMDTDLSNAAVVVASEAHTITLAVEGLLGVVSTVASLTDEAVAGGEIGSPQSCPDTSERCTVLDALLCISMIDATWLTILDALSMMLTRSHGEAIVLEILKGYQAFTQACGVLHVVEPLNSYLASLCKFAISLPNEVDKKSTSHFAGAKHTESLIDQREGIVLTPKNVQALRTLFNIAHRLHNELGPSWVLVLDTLAALDWVIHAPLAASQDVSGQLIDLSILSSLNSQLFGSSELMNISAVRSLLSSLHQLSRQYVCGNVGSMGSPLKQRCGNIIFAVEKMIHILVSNMRRVEALWDQVVRYLLELVEVSNSAICNAALDGLDQSICAVLGSERFHRINQKDKLVGDEMNALDGELSSLEAAVISPLAVLYTHENFDARQASLKILVHVLERYGDVLCFSWPKVLDLLRSVANSSEKDLLALGFQSMRVIMSDGLASMPAYCVHDCIEVTGAYSWQKTDLNISLTAIGLLWTATDFSAHGIKGINIRDKEDAYISGYASLSLSLKGLDKEMDRGEHFLRPRQDMGHAPMMDVSDCNKLLLVLSILQKLGVDERPEVRNSAIKTLFQILGGHGHKFTRKLWEECLQNFTFPVLAHVVHLAESSSKDEWLGSELGVRQGEAVHMLIHHSRNTAQKQWDETLVLVLGGITRILRSFFPCLQTLKGFWKGWETMLLLIRNCITKGSKEVAFAAIYCLQITVASHCPKGNLPVLYLKSVLDMYELVIQHSTNRESNTEERVMQDVLHGLGEIYVHTKMMFDSGLYLQLLSIAKLAIGYAEHDSYLESEPGTIRPIQCTVLDTLKVLQPTTQLTLMWPHYLLELASYLTRFYQLSEKSIVKNAVAGTSCSHAQFVLQDGRNADMPFWDEIEADVFRKLGPEDAPDGTLSPVDCHAPLNSCNRDEGTCSVSQSVVDSFSMTAGYQIFVQSLVRILVDLLEHAPPVEKSKVLPDIIRQLGRCMYTRRDNPDSQIWRSAAEGFNKILLHNLNKPTSDCDGKKYSDRTARSRLWKEVADVYETFLVGCCGHAFPSESLSSAALQADELLEMSSLTVLGEHILRPGSDAPDDVLQRLVRSLDHCASRIGCLPVEMVELIPPHCSRFSLACLQMMFSLCRCPCEGDHDDHDMHLSRSNMSKIALRVLLSRCEHIIKQFVVDECSLGGCPLPIGRTQEMLHVLEGLAQLLICVEIVDVLPLPSYLLANVPSRGHHVCHTHLIALYPCLCELFTTREADVRKAIQVLLRLISTELGLQKLSNYML